MIKDEEIKEICGGIDYTIFSKYNGELYGFGNNYYGQLGIENKENQNKPVLILNENKKIKKIRCGYCFVFILFEDGELKGFGQNHNGQSYP